MADLLAIEHLTRRLRRGRGAVAGLAHDCRRASRSRCSAATAWARPRWSTRSSASRAIAAARSGSAGATSRACAPTSARMPASAGCRRSATSSSRSPWTRTSPPWRGPGRGPPSKVYAMFPRLAERRAQSRQPALRRRAADARGRPRADPQSAHHPARRAARGPRADHRRGAARGARSASSARKACRRSWSSRTRKKILGVTDRAAIIERGGIVHRGRKRRARRRMRRCWRSISASPTASG